MMCLCERKPTHKVQVIIYKTKYKLLIASEAFKTYEIKTRIKASCNWVLPSYFPQKFNIKDEGFICLAYSFGSR